MSVYCPNCQMLSYDEDRCDYCNKMIDNQSGKGIHFKDSKKPNNRITTKKYMTKCEICGEHIAVKATSCPYCGDTKSKNLFWKIVKIVAIVMVALFLLNILLASIGIVILGSAAKEANRQNNEAIKEISKQGQKLIDKAQNMKFPVVDFDKQQREREHKKKLQELRKQEEILKQKIRIENKKNELKRQMQ